MSTSYLVLDIETVLDAELPIVQAAEAERLPAPPHHKVVVIGALMFDSSYEIKRIGDREFAQVSSANMAQRIKWCDNGVDEIKTGKLDVFNNASLTRPLTSFGRT